LLERIAHFLPAQNPLDNFVHHNTLHSFEHLDFRAGVEKAAKMHGARPWGTKRFYRRAYEAGRILDCDLDAVLRREVPSEDIDIPDGGMSRREVTRLLMLEPETGLSDPEASAWSLHDRHYMEELPVTLHRRSVERLRTVGPPERVIADLWRACDEIAVSASRETGIRRLGDEVQERLGRDLDLLVEPNLIRWATAFLDVGQSAWAMPGRERGFLRASLDHLSALATLLLPGGAWLRREARRLRAEDVDALDIVIESLVDIGVGNTDAEAFLSQTWLVLPGLAGMFERLKQHPDLAPGPVPLVDGTDFLAVRLLLERAGTRFALAQVGDSRNGASLRRCVARYQRDRVDPHADFVRVGPLFSLALTLGLRPADLRAASRDQIDVLQSLLAQEHDWTLRWLWHLAYERRYRVELLDAIVLNGRAPVPSASEPHTQVLTCIDDREESLRRHLEELDPLYSTYGYAGHYGVAVRFRGVGQAAFRALCPASVTPTHALLEVPVDEASANRFEISTLLGHDILRGDTAEKGVVPAAAQALVGMFALLPMAWRLLAPEASASARRRARKIPPTRMSLVHDPASPKVFDLPLGFTDDEMADIVATALTEMGLVHDFAPLVVVLGHGSSSVNNPHAAGYNCGACSGGEGGPNARAFAAMGNRRSVRDLLATRGITVPDSCWFVGGLHDTASGEVRLYDRDLVPSSHREQVARVEADFAKVAATDAHERCRRFASAPLDLSEADALRHAVGRTEDLAQARPEYNHVTNASCVVGRREITRGLFLDRRAFLVSYDPEDDPNSARLGRILASVGPVGAGINLEYFFSYIDNERYGAGTKLPHNVVGLIGVMNGSSSDLRTGLVEQMVEIHEPMRLMVVVEGSPKAVEEALEGHDGVTRLTQNRWILVAAYDPDRGEASFLEPSGWVRHELESTALPTASSSREWYDGHRDCLHPVRISVDGAGSAPC